MAMMIPTPDCELFLPGHHVHFIQWKLSLKTEAPQRVQLVSREGLSMLVRVEDHQELWRFHDDAQDRKALERCERGARAELLDHGLLKVANGHLYTCRRPEDWQDCRTRSSLQFDSEDPADQIAQQTLELGGYLGA